MKKFLQWLLSPKKALTLGIATFAVLAGMVSLHAIQANAAEKTNCDSNAVIWCGAKSATTLETSYTKGDGHNSAASIQHIYNSSVFGISSSDIASMGTTAVEGYVTKSGDVYAGSTLVATNAFSAGRTNISGSKKYTNDGTTFYVRPPSTSFLVSSITAMVVMKDGVFQYAILHACGNPVIATPKKPNYSINKQVRAGTSGSYSSDVTVKSGSTVSYQITVSSTGAVPAVNVNVHDTLPAAIAYTSGTLEENGTAVSSANASKFFSTGLLLSSIKNGSKNVFTFNAVAGTTKDTDDSCKPATALNNEGYITAPGLPGEQSGAKVNTTCTPPVVALSCVSLAAIAGTTNATTGDQAYTLNATASVKNATITGYVFTFGDGKTQTVNSATTTASASHTYAPGNYTASVVVSATANGKTYTATADACKTPIKVSPAPIAACTDLKAIVTDRTNIALNATASASNGATISGYDFVVKNAAGTTVASPSVTTGAQTASTNLTVATAGTYTATVSVNTSLGAKTAAACKTNFTINAAPAAACTNLQAIVTDRTNVALNAAATADNGATISGYAFVVKNSAGTTVASPVVTTAAKTATANLTLATAGDYTATVTVTTSLGAKTSDACKASFTITTAPTPNVTITKYVDHVKREQVNVNQNFVYEVTVKNTGNVDLTNVVVTDPAPQGVTMLSTDLGTVANNGLNYTIPSLKVGASVSFNITAKVAEYVAGDIVNTACVNAPEVNPTQPTKPDACDTATVTVTPPTPKNPNITIVKTVDGKKQEQVNTNQNFVYQLVITNTGEIDLTNVVVTDPAPQGVTMLSTDLGTIDGNALSYTIPSLAVGKSITLNITADVTVYVAGNLVNTACVNAPEVNPTQPDQTDACDTATVTVTPPVETPPTVLPNTGAGDVIGVFAGAVVAGTFGYRLFLSRKLARR